jgi:hypothetical protein
MTHSIPEHAFVIAMLVAVVGANGSMLMATLYLTPAGEARRRQLGIWWLRSMAMLPRDCFTPIGNRWRLAAWAFILGFFGWWATSLALAWGH